MPLLVSATVKKMYNLYYNSNNIYCLNIPKRLRIKTGIDKYNFLIMHPRSGYYNVNKEIFQRVCSIRKSGNLLHVLIDRNQNKVLYDSIEALSTLVQFTPYMRRYMALYKSYEPLEKNIPIEFRAIRHGLSHSSNVLSAPKTIEVLEKLFSTKHIDLNKWKHINIFCTHFARMLMEHDKILHKFILSNLNNLVVVGKNSFCKTKKGIIT